MSDATAVLAALHGGIPVGSVVVVVRFDNSNGAVEKHVVPSYRKVVGNIGIVVGDDGDHDLTTRYYDVVLSEEEDLFWLADELEVLEWGDGKEW